MSYRREFPVETDTTDTQLFQENNKRDGIQEKHSAHLTQK